MKRYTLEQFQDLVDYALLNLWPGRWTVYRFPEEWCLTVHGPNGESVVLSYLDLEYCYSSPRDFVRFLQLSIGKPKCRD